MQVHVWTEEDGIALVSRLRRERLDFTVTRTSAEKKCSCEPRWLEMPKYVNDIGIFKSFWIELPSRATWDALSRVLRQDTSRHRSGELSTALWYPARPKRDLQSMVYSGPEVQPRYPIYIISKGRWESRLTVKALERMRVRYRIVVEPQEVENYAAVLPRENILPLPARLSNLGQGGIPARNFVWDHAVRSGAKRHWILDDNIQHFFRRNHNAKRRVLSGAIFRAAEDFVDRWANVPLAGFQYDFFVPDAGTSCLPPFALNRRIYSCILIDHHQISHLRWRGKYNEDTDLSLRVLKEGYCTILFHAFLQKKIATMRMKGGNTDSLYKNGRMEFVRSLVKQHGDVARHVVRYGRDHHQVDFSAFRNNPLVPRKGGQTYTGRTNEYGMHLISVSKQSRSPRPSRSPRSRRSSRSRPKS